MARVREFDTEAAVDAALVVFRRKGFEGASVSDLVAATGVGRGSLYGAFGNKDGLYLAAMDRYRQRQVDVLVEALGGDASPRARLRAMLDRLVEQIVETERGLSCLMISASLEHCDADPRVAVRLREAGELVLGALAGTIAEGQRTGEIAADRDPYELARFLNIAMQGMRVTGTAAPDRTTLSRAAELALTCLD